MSVTARQAQVGFLILFLVVLLVVVAALYWHRVIGVNFLHLLAYVPGPIGMGC
jgi:uncharacterized membrane protein YwaF